MGVITWLEFYYLQSMADNVPYHLGIVLAKSIHHLATEPRAHLRGLYITRLIRG